MGIASRLALFAVAGTLTCGTVITSGAGPAGQALAQSAAPAEPSGTQLANAGVTSGAPATPAEPTATVVPVQPTSTITPPAAAESLPAEGKRLDEPAAAIDAAAMPQLAMPTAPPTIDSVPAVPKASDTAASSAATPTAPPQAATAAPAPGAPVVAPTPAVVEKPAPVVTAAERLGPIIAEIRELVGKPQFITGKGAERESREALRAFYSAADRLPIWVDENGFSAAGRKAVDEVRSADDWGLRAKDFELPAKVEGSPEAAARAEIEVSLAVLKYARHARGGRVDPLDLSNYLDRKSTFVPPKTVLEQIALAPAADAYLRGLHPQHPQFERLRQKYLELRTAAPAAAPAASTSAAEDAPQSKGKKASKKTAASAPPAVSSRKLIANMEMWRWMPTDLGQRYIMPNIPEFQFRYVKDGKPIHTERIIVGKVQNQTPVFSDMMEHIIFHPTWNVPDSIKVKELLPSLARGGNILQKQGLKASYNGKLVDPQSIDWVSVDIRQMHVFQPSGNGNALGLMKFMFPNQHSVYMHDTPTKPLFNSASRAFSHGCVRVRNPQRFAEVILAEDKGWGPERIRSLLDTRIENNQVNLTTRIPVHVSYFTTWVDDDGTVHAYRDIYGYEDKIHLGLDGKAHLIVKPKENLRQIRAEVVGRLVETKASKPADLFSVFEQLFGGN